MAKTKEFIAPLSEGIITKEALEEWKKRIGIKLRVDPFNENVREESLRNFANGIGDANPLWFLTGNTQKGQALELLWPNRIGYTAFSLLGSFRDFLGFTLIIQAMIGPFTSPFTWEIKSLRSAFSRGLKRKPADLPVKWS